LCESHAAQDHAAAVLIQRRWRGYRDRRWLAFLSACALRIQTQYRGFKGRQRFMQELAGRELAAQKSYFDAQAVMIQKYVRGFLSRKYAQDIYARRSYIQTVARTGDTLLEASDAAQLSQLAALAAKSEEDRGRAFESLTRNMHHLLSTRAIPSVFQAPLATGVGAGEAVQVTAFDIPMEEHIKEAFRNRQTTLRKLRVSRVSLFSHSSQCIFLV